MKTKIIILTFISSILVVTASCKKDDSATNDTANKTTVRSASWKIGSSSFSDSKPYIGIFTSNGNVSNTMTLTAADGSIIEFNFDGTSNATFQLDSYSDAYYKNAAGKQFNSTSGELIVTSYTTTDNTRKATGTFHFKALATQAPYDSLEITTGVFTNASNEFGK
ncbi:MAG: hypothetical protein WCK02_16970 [Bacteroidota bacterium]